MVFWLSKTKKRVGFTDEVADQTLLAVVQKELQNQPHKSFGDLCKEALWHYLYVPESVKPTRKSADASDTIAELQGQLRSLEERIAAREASRLDALEQQLQQLSLQVGQLAIALNNNQRGNYQPPQQPYLEPIPEPQPEPEPEPEPVAPPKPVDPLLQRLSSFIDDF
jgi:TolA-binding protein